MYLRGKFKAFSFEKCEEQIGKLDSLGFTTMYNRGVWTWGIGIRYNRFDMANPNPVTDKWIFEVPKNHAFKRPFQTYLQSSGKRGTGNVVTYGAAIGACEKTSQWQWAIVLLSDLCERQMESNVLLSMQSVEATYEGLEPGATVELSTDSGSPSHGVPSSVNFYHLILPFEWCIMLQHIYTHPFEKKNCLFLVDWRSTAETSLGKRLEPTTP